MDTQLFLLHQATYFRLALDGLGKTSLNAIVSQVEKEAIALFNFIVATLLNAAPFANNNSLFQEDILL